MCNTTFNTAKKSQKLLCKIVYKPKSRCVRVLATVDTLVTGKQLCARLADYTSTDISLQSNSYEVFPALVKAVQRACTEFSSERVTVAISNSTWNRLADTVGEWDQDSWDLLKWPYGGVTEFIGDEDFVSKFITE